VIELAGSAAHVVVDDIGVPALSDADTHHLARVLRLRDGERVTATNGIGSWRWCRWVGGGLEPEGDVSTVQRPQPEVSVAFAIVKGDRLDWIVQKLTELGVDRVMPLEAERCVVRWDAPKAAAQTERLRRIAREAAMQSRRVWLPVVDTLAPAVDVLSAPEAYRADFGGRMLAPGAAAGVHTVAIGPEGGWSPGERAVSDRVVALGDTVLRSETAAIAAGVLLLDRRRATA
jgi:16S rRNA (uracil1498-N3)-methyltransferase